MSSVSDTVEQRISFTESYDPQFGFITDAIVDPELEGARTPVMARPAIVMQNDLGTLTASTVPVALTFFRALTNFGEKEYAVVMNASGPGVDRYHISIYNLTDNVLVGTLDVIGDTTTIPLSGTFTPAANSVWSLSSIVPAAPGTGYVVGDIVYINGIEFINGVIGEGVTVTSVNGTGGITGISSTIVGLVDVPPTNPLTQDSTSGVGVGATFNADFIESVGVVAQYAEPGQNFWTFVGVTLTVGAFVSKTFAPVGTNTHQFPMIKPTTFDNYIWLLDNKGNLWNSDVGTTFIYNGLNFTNAFSNSITDPIGLATHAGYIVAFGTNEVRFFTVTGAINGSAASPVLGLNAGVGCSFALSIAQQNEYVGFLGAQDSTGIPAFLYAPNTLVPQRITYPLIDKIFSDLSADFVGASFIRFRGHIAYCVTFLSVAYVFDIVVKKWYLWNPPIYTADVSNGLDRVAYINEDIAYTLGYDGHYFLSTLEAPTYAVGDNWRTVPASVYVPLVTTPPVDLGTTRNKQYESAAMVGDQVYGSAHPNIAGISYNDNGNDPSKYSTPRSVDMTSQHPIARNLGQSRRRSWRVQIPIDWVNRYDALEVTFRVGAS